MERNDNSVFDCPWLPPFLLDTLNAHVRAFISIHLHILEEQCEPTIGGRQMESAWLLSAIRPCQLGSAAYQQFISPIYPSINQRFAVGRQLPTPPSHRDVSLSHACLHSVIVFFFLPTGLRRHSAPTFFGSLPSQTNPYQAILKGSPDRLGGSLGACHKVGCVAGVLQASSNDTCLC
ncbi:hypothetical protein BS50DRAFT_312181 [Corynespora cassiicola Philippines]|uniref:Uncharacterized protein n=1 Tax=Corynespora cassiicola Philippines TaxID=1448308 RepID=A0A2T2NYC0_CORCC|nr:hypothetical protein BS50DRAFT_312181 [Corynespora cassiicola Philippines]